MTDERSPESTLRGRLADIYVPALVAGSLSSPSSVAALARRLGNRATVDDPLGGRASSLASVETLLLKVAQRLQGGRYEHVVSTTSVDRDVAEGRVVGVLGGRAFTLPIAVVAERRRLREIEIRVYYAPTTFGDEGVRASLPEGAAKADRTDGKLGALGSPLASMLEALGSGAVDHALASFEENARLVDASGGIHTRSSGAMRALLTRSEGALDLQAIGGADDGRTACVEGALRRSSGAVPALVSFQRGDSGLFSELRIYA